MLENTIKGWVLSLIGLAGMVITILHGFGIYEIPNPEILSKTYECVIAFLVSLGFFVTPKTKIDEWVERLINFLIEKFTKKQ